MENHLIGFDNPTDYEVWACALLLYPAKGINGACAPLCDTLGEEGIRVFRDIFTNNNAAMITEFFTHPVIVKLWPQVARRMESEHCFKKTGPNESIRLTYCKITQTLEEKFNLQVPVFWRRAFPAAN